MKGVIVIRQKLDADLAGMIASHLEVSRESPVTGITIDAKALLAKLRAGSC